jgi:hypothetical protein
MDPDKIKAALEALKNDDGAAAIALLEELIVSMASGEAPPADAPAEPLADAPDAPKQEDEQVAATALMRLTGASSVGEALLACDQIKARLDKDESDRAAADRVARRDLVAELVRLGVEFPATAWAGDAEKRVPVKRLADEPLDELRARVELHRRTRPATTGARPPASGAAAPAGDGSKQITTPHGVITLSKGELANCAQYGANVEQYAANKALHLAARSGGVTQ